MGAEVRAAVARSHGRAKAMTTILGSSTPEAEFQQGGAELIEPADGYVGPF